MLLSGLGLSALLMVSFEWFVYEEWSNGWFKYVLCFFARIEEQR